MTTKSDLLASLPAALQERTRRIHTGLSPGSGEFVLYWMRTAIRATENPALSVAIAAANQISLSVLVYQGVSERYPYASDRHHVFLLQGAHDVQREFAERGVEYALHVERDGHRGPHLKTLAERAALVVTEDMPVAPINRWTESLCRNLSSSVLAVDTACVVPMRLVGKSYERAFAFRDATKKLYADRVSADPLPEEAPSHSTDSAIELPFAAVDLGRCDIAELISQCEIDHSIGPVPHTIGGSMAGYERWSSFKRRGLAKYDRLRNNALIDGVSRMSAYLHYGMVSPMRIAREAAAETSSGAAKYLDALLIWRELAYSYCFFRRDHDRISSLPKWARETLSNHESDPRSALLSWESLARGRSGDSLWDSAQRSLLRHGELHNNVRMTWGKAILNWSPNAKTALSRIIDLNHRYALDGRDPASYGGILWCLGQFDRPFSPEQPIFGSVRARSTTQHVERLDPNAYRRKVSRPLYNAPRSVAVIGAGLSGVVCARTLSDHGFDVKVFEKSRGLGGRMATRRVNDQLIFDHGAQYFTARDKRFKSYVHSWMDDGVVQPWLGRIVVIENGSIGSEKRTPDRFVAVPGMNSIAKHVASELDVRLQTRVAPIQRHGGKWHLFSDEGIELGRFDFVVVATPAGQAAQIVGDESGWAEQAQRTKMSECWSVMFAPSKPVAPGFDAAFVHQSPLSWIAMNSSKPERDDRVETWTLHASADWTREHIHAKPADIERLLVGEFEKLIGAASATTPAFVKAHLWRFALPPDPLSEDCLFDPQRQVGACGDWCGGPRVEGAFLSGMAIAGRINGLANRLSQESKSTDRSQLELF